MDHCYCNLKDPRVGGMVDPETANHMRSGIPICSTQCAARYDRDEERRHPVTRARVGGQNIGRGPVFDVVI